VHVRIDVQILLAEPKTCSLVVQSLRHIRNKLHLEFIVHPLLDAHNHVQVHHESTARRALRSAAVGDVYVFACRVPVHAVFVGQASEANDFLKDDILEFRVDETLSGDVEAR
jgi:hypothetical protein